MVGDEIRHARRNLKSLRENETLNNIEQKQCAVNSCVSPKIDEASVWLAANYDAIEGNRLLTLMSKFELSVLDAVHASKRAHALHFAGGGE